MEILTSKIDKIFNATIEKKGNGWVYITWPQSVDFFKTTRSVKVSGTIDDQNFQTAFMPWGDGTQFLPLSAALLKKLKKQVGDTIKVHLKERILPTKIKGGSDKNSEPLTSG